MKFCGEEKSPEHVDDIMGWFYSVPWDRRRGGKWNVSREEFRRILIMKDGAGMYLFQPNLKSDGPPWRGYFLGCPVIIDGDTIGDKPHGEYPYCHVKTAALDRFCDRCGAPL